MKRPLYRNLCYRWLNPPPVLFLSLFFSPLLSIKSRLHKHSLSWDCNHESECSSGPPSYWYDMWKVLYTSWGVNFVILFIFLCFGSLCGQWCYSVESCVAVWKHDPVCSAWCQSFKLQQLWLLVWLRRKRDPCGWAGHVGPKTSTDLPSLF